MKSFLWYHCFIGICSTAIVAGVADAESLIKPQHRVTLNQAHKGNLEVDTLLLDSYGRPPENIRQFYLDARAAFAEEKNRDFSHQSILSAAREHGIPLLGGPMLGDLGSDHVSVWLRPATSEVLELLVRDAGGKQVGRISLDKVKPGVETRFRVDGLTPLSRYEYTVLMSGNEIANGAFTTAPEQDLHGVMRIAFGADFHKVGLHNPNLFNQILKRDPLVMLLYGDQAADGRRNMLNMHRSDYLLRDVSQPWRQFVSRTPVYATWDDWDYFTNDTNGVPKNYTEADRDAVRGIWHSNWNNPTPPHKRDGIYFKTRIGSVEVFMLDTRSCRDNDRRGEYLSYLGKQQQEWLKNGLKASTAPFKIISSGTMWSDYVSKAKDTWGSWDIEAREELFSLIEDEAISGVLLISGDRHGARGFRIPRESGFELFEFEVGTLGGVPGPPAMVKDCPEQIFGYEGNGTIAFGEFIIDTSLDDPTVTFRLIHESGKVLEKHVLTHSQLTHRP